MVEPEEALPKKSASDKAGKPQLSQDFYKKLLHLPPCKTGGECNNCGRCEH